MNIFELSRAAIVNSLAHSLQPVMIFDLDDTLIDCRHRKHLVIQEFIKQSHIKRDFANECLQLERIDWQTWQYRVLDTLHQLNIKNQIFTEKLQHYWLAHYFSYRYLLLDQPFQEALNFVRHCYQAGATIVYLSGRDEPGMGAGTRESLMHLGFPLLGPRLHCILKLDPEAPDLDFKVAALEVIARFGNVIAALENELINLNAMAERFPQAAMYWRKTLYMPNPPNPHERIQILHAFH